MNNTIGLFIGLCALVIIQQRGITESKVCTKQTVYYVHQHYCSSKFLWWCTSAYRRLTRYSLTRYCCTGYTGSGCTTPICNPPCNSGGTCVAPNVCTCPDGHAGDQCQNTICSHVYPCFPGNCTDPRDCTCQSGFQGTNCSETTREILPEITQCSTKIYNIRRVDGKELYRYWADASSPNSTETEVLWVNEQRFNYLIISFQAIYNTPIINDLPSYIRDFSFGITDAYIRLVLEKLDRNKQSSSFVSLNETKSCAGNLSSTNPVEGVYKCNITYPQFDRNLEHGDFINVTVTVESGGYREIIDVSTGNVVIVEPYTSQTVSKTMQFYFDFIKPYHCLENGTCTSLPLSVSEDITKSSINVSWDGWRDDLSGIDKYTFEVHRLIKDIVTGDLTEENPLTPLYKENVTMTVKGITYRPPGPGAYSFVLGVTDKANNSAYARQIVIYDPESEVTIANPDNFFVTSTENGTDHKWQSNLQDNYGNGSQVVIYLPDYFTNAIHTAGGFLNKVAKYPDQRLEEDERNMLLKSVSDEYDDHTGRRTIDMIPNRNGIVELEYVYLKDYANGSDIDTMPEVGWKDMNLTDDQKSINIPRLDGETIRIWIRARDVMGNSLHDNVTVYFDASAPIVSNISLLKNADSGMFLFNSRLMVSAFDEDSGIRLIRWRLIDEVKGRILKIGDISVGHSDICGNVDCQCIPAGLCFKINHTIDFDNCLLVVPKENLTTQVMRLETEVVNLAMVSTVNHFEITNLTSFEGIEEDNGIENLKTEGSYTDRVRIVWDVRPSCYEREDFVILYTNNKNNVTHNLTTDKDSTYFDIYDLSPDTSYTIEVQTNYIKDDNPQYSRVIYKTIAEIDGGMSIAFLTSVCSVLALLLGLIVIGIILLRTGQLEGAKKRVRKRITMYLERPLTTFGIVPHKRKTGVYSGTFDEDIYSFGEMNLSDNERWLINFDDIVLEEKIAKGHFSDIHRAVLYEKETVATKILKEGFSEEDKLVMTAKINFNASKLGAHSNVLRFVGMVLNHPSFGPYMVLEHCENGPLRDWLRKQKDKVNDDVIDRLCELLCGIGKGMEYLASKEIVHRRLSAKNVLLNADMEPKITGFGPTPEQVEGEEKPRKSRVTFFLDNSGGKKRIPIKWVAPECLKSSQEATSQSDVWSLGIVIWETFSLGEIPYPGIQNKHLLKKLQEGYRMKKPEFCPDIFASVMFKCWNEDPDERPLFQQTVEEMEKFYNERYSCNIGEIETAMDVV